MIIQFKLFDYKFPEDFNTFLISKINTLIKLINKYVLYFYRISILSRDVIFTFINVIKKLSTYVHISISRFDNKYFIVFYMMK